MRIKRIALLYTTSALSTNAVPCHVASQTMVSVPSSVNNYAQIPNVETLKKNVGFEPKVPEILAGGFKFPSGTIAETYDGDVSSSATSKRTGISFRYTSDRNTAKTASFSVELYDGRSVKENASVSIYGDTELYYSTQYANHLGWSQNDTYYSLMDVSRGITKDEMTTVAKEVIDMGTDAVNEK